MGRSHASFGSTGPRLSRIAAVSTVAQPPATIRSAAVAAGSRGSAPLRGADENAAATAPAKIDASSYLPNCLKNRSHRPHRDPPRIRHRRSRAAVSSDRHGLRAQQPDSRMNNPARWRTHFEARPRRFTRREPRVTRRRTEKSSQSSRSPHRRACCARPDRASRWAATRADLADISKGGVAKHAPNGASSVAGAPRRIVVAPVAKCVQLQASYLPSGRET